MLRTEKDYVKDLEVLSNIFMKPIMESNIIDPNDVNLLFSNCDMIFSANSELLMAFEKAIRPDSVDSEGISKAFVTMTPYFRMYSLYCNNYQYAMERLTALCDSNRKFASLISTCSMHPDARCLDLGSFLIKPVQRIYKYPLFLKDMIKAMGSDTKYTAPLQAALSATNTLADEVNKKMSERKNQMKVITIYHELYGEVEDLVQPHRRLVMEADEVIFQTSETSILKSITRSVKKPYKIYVFNDIFLLAQKSVFFAGKKYQVKYRFDMLDCIFQDPFAADEEGSKLSKLSFSMVHIGESVATSYKFILSSAKMKMELLSALRVNKIKTEEITADKDMRVKAVMERDDMALVSNRKRSSTMDDSVLKAAGLSVVLGREESDDECDEEIVEEEETLAELGVPDSTCRKGGGEGQGTPTSKTPPPVLEPPSRTSRSNSATKFKPLPLLPQAVTASTAGTTSAPLVLVPAPAPLPPSPTTTPTTDSKEGEVASGGESGKKDTASPKAARHDWSQGLEKSKLSPNSKNLGKKSLPRKSAPVIGVVGDLSDYYMRPRTPAKVKKEQKNSEKGGL
jgi:hypothetical protein